MATYKWAILGVFYGPSRTDPDVLVNASPYVNVGEISGAPVIGDWYDTIGEAEAFFSTLTGITPVLPYEIERVSYPIQVGGPLSVYLPDVSPSYTEYPYDIEMYNYAFTAYRGLDSPLYYTTLVIVSGLGIEDVIPPPGGPPDPVTIQLKRDNTLAKYSVNPPDASVLPKYGAPVKFIRANFDTTRVAVITETITGGFMIYEEASLGVATGPVYIYSSKRKLIHIVSVDVIDQYRLYTF